MTDILDEDRDRIEDRARNHAGSAPAREYIIDKLAYIDGASDERIYANAQIDKVKRDIFKWVTTRFYVVEDVNNPEGGEVSFWLSLDDMTRLYEQSKLKDAKGEG